MTDVFAGQTSTFQQRPKTVQVTKEANTLLGRDYVFVDASSVTQAMRDGARSSSKAISVEGCQSISRTAATATPGVLAAYTLSCGYVSISFYTFPPLIPFLFSLSGEGEGAVDYKRVGLLMALRSAAVDGYTNAFSEKRTVLLTESFHLYSE